MNKKAEKKPFTCPPEGAAWNLDKDDTTAQDAGFAGFAGCALPDASAPAPRWLPPHAAHFPGLYLVESLAGGFTPVRVIVILTNATKYDVYFRGTDGMPAALPKFSKLFGPIPE